MASLCYAVCSSVPSAACSALAFPSKPYSVSSSVLSFRSFSSPTAKKLKTEAEAQPPDSWRLLANTSTTWLKTYGSMRFSFLSLWTWLANAYAAPLASCGYRLSRLRWRTRCCGQTLGLHQRNGIDDCCRQGSSASIETMMLTVLATALNLTFRQIHIMLETISPGTMSICLYAKQR
jgi:hypothetical protein